MVVLKESVEAGEVQAVIDRRYPLAEMAEAHRYVETGCKKGNVIVIIERRSGQSDSLTAHRPVQWEA